MLQGYFQLAYNGQALIRSPRSVIRCGPPEISEVAQMKQAQEGLAAGACLSTALPAAGNNSFLEGGLKLIISVLTGVYPSATGTHFT